MTTALTRDAFLGGRVHLYQPAEGYRAGVDPVLLAASVPAIAGQSVLELGCGAGAALLCLGSRVEGLDLTGVELQPHYRDLAERNAAENGIRADIRLGDIRQLPPDIRQRRFDHILMNPPYFDRTAGTRASDLGRDMALGGETPIETWIDIASKRLTPKGYLTLIQRIERLPEVMVATEPRLGSVVICPIAARRDRPPALFLMQARKGGHGAFRLAPPLILHCGDTHVKDGDDYSETATNVLRHGAGLDVF